MALSLQICQNCQTVQYPAREVCVACICGDLARQDVPAAGTILSWTRGHISALPAFKDKTPIDLARIKLDAGPIVIAFTQSPPESGDRVTVSQDADGLLRAE